MGRAKNKTFVAAVRDKTNPLYNREYDEYVNWAQGYSKGGTLEELAARAAFRSKHINLMTGPFARTLGEQKAEISRKTQSGVRRDAQNIMVPIDGCDRVVVQFETGKFRPKKAAPYPLGKLGVVLKKQGPKERTRAFFQPVNHHKTIVLVVGSDSNVRMKFENANNMNAFTKTGRHGKYCPGLPKNSIE